MCLTLRSTRTLRKKPRKAGYLHVMHSIPPLVLAKVPTREKQKGGRFVSQIFEFPILTHLLTQMGA